ncbi:MAG: PAS domain S-box protein [Trueperaceae bacterium]|nr:PAS domain S-box protein [Trueperaceae bacterium]
MLKEPLQFKREAPPLFRLRTLTRTLRIQLLIFSLLITAVAMCSAFYFDFKQRQAIELEHLEVQSQALLNRLNGSSSERLRLALLEAYQLLPDVSAVELWQDGRLYRWTDAGLEALDSSLSAKQLLDLAESPLDNASRWLPLADEGQFVHLILNYGHYDGMNDGRLGIILVSLIAFVAGISFLLLYLEGPIRALKKAAAFAAELGKSQEQTLKLERVAVEFDELETALNGLALELQHKEYKLNFNAQRLASVLDYAVDGIMTINAQGKLDLVNPACLRMFGYESDDMLGQPIEKFIEGLDAVPPDPSKTNLMRIIARHQAGYSFPIEVTQNFIGDEEQRLRVVIVRDLSERHHYENALRASEAKTQKLSLVASRTSNAVLISDDQARIEWVNDGFTRITGFNLLETKGKGLIEVLLGKGANSKPYQDVQTKLDLQQSYQTQIQNVSKSGRPYWLYLELQPMLDQEDKFTGFMVIATDITEQREAQKLLKQQRDFALAVMSTAAQGIGVVGKDWTYEYVNPAFERITGYRSQDLLGKLPSTLFSKEQAFWERYKQKCLQKEITSTEIQMVHAQGQTLEVLMTSVPRFQGEEFLGTIVTISDITQSKLENKELLAAKEAAEAANKAKNEFLSRMSHELRTPLNAILGFAQLLELDDLNQDQSENVDRILGAGRHLLDLINEVLDISRIETGSISLTIEPVECERLAKESMTLMQPLAKSQRVKLELEPELDTSLRVMGDPQRLKQVFINLLSNAVKYNRVLGQVFIGWQVHGGNLRCWVRDTGPGIAKEKLSRLFIPFDRLDAEHSSIEGSGIGLALTRRLVEVMGGKMSVESQPGEGSTFFVDLPLAPKAVEETLEGLDNDSQLRVIYIEDDLPNVSLIRKIFSKLPHTQLRTAMQGELGLKLIREEKPQLVLLDLNLPDISGEEVLSRLKANEETRSIPIIILSADATESTTERLLAAGALAYLYKPVNVPKLMQLVEGIRLDAIEQKQSSAPVETLDLLRLAQKILKERPQAQQLRLEQVQVFQDLQSIVSLTNHTWKTGGSSLAAASDELLNCLARVSEAAIDPSGKHSARVGQLASFTAAQLGCDEAFVDLIAKAAQVHDLGAMAVTDTILLKPDSLTESERNIMQLHCEIGADMLSDGHSELFKMAADIARSHHERWDGSGYPQCLKEEDIPLAARIVAVADVYDALLQTKPYKKAWRSEDALDYITEQAASLFDPDVVVAFLQVCHDHQMFGQTIDMELSLS